MFTLPPKRGTTRKQKFIKKGELVLSRHSWECFIVVTTFIGQLPGIPN